MVKEQGGENDLLARIAGDPMFGVTLEELHDIVKAREVRGPGPGPKPPSSSPRWWPRCWRSTKTWQRKKRKITV